jgi:hypothetical protein
VTDCIGSDYESISSMKHEAVQVDYETLAEAIGEPFLVRQSDLGYDDDLRMENDWHVSYWRSTYRGRPCLYFAWSGIEQIFCEVGS